MNIELYIAGKLCDLEKSDLSIRIRRQFITPTELNSKDAQKSYSITLPSTPINDEIFRHKNIEETDGKFSIYPDARLYVNGILIMEGRFRLTEITSKSYKGNLGVPSALTIKDVFDEMKMNEAVIWKVAFENTKAISQCNNDKNSPVIFPLALYGLLPKVDTTNTGYTSKNIFDEQVKLRIDDLPPSINCMETIKNLFASKEYQLTGTALEDPRLNNLFMSYKNPNDYETDWGAGSIKCAVEGWQMFSNDEKLEPNKYSMTEDSKKMIYLNLFDLKNKPLETIKDTFGNIRETGTGKKIIIPHSGLYKIEFNCDIRVIKERIPASGSYKYHEIHDQKVRIINSYDHMENDLYRFPTEILLMKNRDEDYTKYTYLNRFFANNIRHRAEDGYLNVPFPKEEKISESEKGINYRYKTYPNFIDPLVSTNLIAGFSFGRKLGIAKEEESEIITEVAARSQLDDLEDISDKYYNHPRTKSYCFPMVASGGYSWSASHKSGTQDKSYSVVYSPGYIKYPKYNSDEVEDAHCFKIDLQKNKTQVCEAWVKTDYQPADTLKQTKEQRRNAKGKIEQVVWFDKGDTLDVIQLVQTERWNPEKRGEMQSIFNQAIDFDLTITPFKKDKDWIKMNDNGASTKAMNWDEPSEFMDKEINLSEFLPSDSKVNDWLDNFCKAFNLKLSNPEKGVFSLDLKENSLKRKSSLIIDLDHKTSVEQRANEPLNLPKTYDIGFSINKDEEGYHQNELVNKEPVDGGGTFDTDNTEGGVISQKSNFSYNWYKTLYRDEKQEYVFADVPVIADKEAWKHSFDYREMMSKKYFSKPQRFWYRSSTIPINTVYGVTDLALVSNTYDGKKPLWLNYENKPDSILTEYFMLLTNNKSYTVVECYLSPEEYNQLDKCYVRFNGDIYLVAEVDGYDPMQRNKATLKLLKKG